MKIIHCADLHLDSKLTSSLSGEKLVLRRREVQSSFSRLVSYAEANDVSAILICGDFLDNPNVRQSVKNEVLQILAGAEKITFLLIEGNHDSGFDSYFYEKLPGNAILLNKQNPQTEFGGVVFTALFPLSVNPELEREKINIAMCHCEAVSYGANSLPTLNLNSLQHLPIDYLALGHIHSYSCTKLGSRGVACYSGCLEGRGFDELGTKGFVLLSIQNKKVLHEFVPFSLRTLHSVDIDIGGLCTYQQIFEACTNALRGHETSSLIKLVLTGKVSDADVDVLSLSDKLSQKFFYVKVVNNTSLQTDALSLSPFTLRHEFLQEVLRLDVTEEQRELVLKYGLRALSDEEVDIL